MRVPNDWSAERASGWWELHYLTHEACGFRTSMPYDLVCHEREVRSIVYGHRCEGGDD